MEAEIEALAFRTVHKLLEKHGIVCLDPRPFLRVTRRQMRDYFTTHLEVAESLVTAEAERPYHDHLCLERRAGGFAVFDMDHGTPVGETFYDSLPEAAADFVAFSYGYGYPEQPPA